MKGGETVQKPNLLPNPDFHKVTAANALIFSQVDALNKLRFADYRLLVYPIKPVTHPIISVAHPPTLATHKTNHQF